ncbi:MAG: hypothetical protein V3S11_01440 [Elusimicrobiota bacterium]
MSRRSLWQRHQGWIAKACALAALILAHPRSQVLFFTGLGLAALGTLLRLWAAGQLRQEGELDRTGPYAMMRRPRLAGAGLFIFGLALTCTTLRYPVSSVLIWSAGVILVWRLLVERALPSEIALESRFGQSHKLYRAQVPLMLPAPNRIGAAFKSTDFSFSRVLKNREHLSALSLFALAFILRCKMAFEL